MDAGRVLREARRRAGLTQRDLAARAHVAQSQIARIERGHTVPRVDTLDELLAACGEGLYARRRMGVGVDRSLIDWMRELPAAARARVAEDSEHYEARGPGEPVRRIPQGSWRPRDAFGVLAAHGVRFVVIGGFAANLHGSPVSTMDTDICYARDDENLNRLAAALRDLDACPSGVSEGLPFVLDERTLKHGLNFTLVTSAGRLDCLGEPAGTTGFDDLDANAVEVQLDDVTVRVASLADLIRMKLAAARPKDLAAVEELVALQEEIDRGSGTE